VAESENKKDNMVSFVVVKNKQKQHRFYIQNWDSRK